MQGVDSREVSQLKRRGGKKGDRSPWVCLPLGSGPRRTGEASAHRVPFKC